jgi:TetR/AcrR family transcriptional regulator, transcriptional repressor for nem operon
VARPRSFDERQVLELARDRFWSTGYAATSVDDVVAATGLGKGSIYAAFGDKHQLFLRVFDDYCERAVRETMLAFEGPDEEAYGRLRSHLDVAASASGAERDHCGCLLAKATAELAGRDAAVSERAVRTFAAIEDLLVACVEAAQRAGDIDSAADARQLGRLLLAVVRGIKALATAGRDEASLQDMADAALATLPRPRPRPRASVGNASLGVVTG